MVSRSLKRRVVRIDPEWQWNFGEFQLNYLNYRSWRIIPSTDLYWGDELYYQSNAYGCKGAEIEEGLPVVGIFGDSVVHGSQGSSFACEMRLPRCPVLNAGVEGMLLPWIVDRVFELKAEIPLACALVHPGWHNLIYNHRGEDYWTEQLNRLEGAAPLVAHFTLVADLNEDIAEAGYDSVLGVLPGYELWGHASAAMDTREGRHRLLDRIDAFNHFLRRYCAERDRVLIDLSPLLKPRSVAELGAKWFDVVHPRQETYADIARFVEAEIAQRLPSAVAKLGAG